MSQEDREDIVLYPTKLLDIKENYFQNLLMASSNSNLRCAYSWHSAGYHKYCFIILNVSVPYSVSIPEISSGNKNVRTPDALIYIFSLNNKPISA